MDFFKEIENKYTAEDFTGYIGSILEEGLTPDSTKFLQEIYSIAARSLERSITPAHKGPRLEKAEEL